MIIDSVYVQPKYSSKGWLLILSTRNALLYSFNLDCHAIAGRENRVALSLKSYAVTNTRIAILNLFNGSLTDVTDLADIGMGGPLSLIWESDESLIGLFAGRGFFRIHIPTGIVEPLKETCDNLIYFYPAIELTTPSWLIAGRHDLAYPEIGHVYFTTSMVMLNTQTGEEWKLDLDQ